MFYVGLDLGQRRDHSAIAVVERVEVMRAYLPPRFAGFHVRHVERVPLGTPYPGVVARMREIVAHKELLGQCAVVVDATGVGGPVVDLLRAARLGCNIDAVTITGGEREVEHRSNRGTVWSVPKQDLIVGVQVLLERGELKIARGLRELGPLVKELLDVSSTPGRRGRVRFGADGVGEHDDLVIALALACWRAKRKQIGHVSQGLPGLLA